MGIELDKYFDLEYLLQEKFDELEEDIFGYPTIETRVNNLHQVIDCIMQNYEELATSKDIKSKGSKHGI